MLASLHNYQGIRGEADSTSRSPTAASANNIANTSHTSYCMKNDASNFRIPRQMPPGQLMLMHKNIFITPFCRPCRNLNVQ